MIKDLVVDDVPYCLLTGGFVLRAFKTRLHGYNSFPVDSHPEACNACAQVSNIKFSFDPSLPPLHRIAAESVFMGGQPLQLDRKYKLATKGYLRQGKDGYTALTVSHAA